MFVPLHNWRLSSVAVHCSPSDKDPSVLSSTSICPVSLIDFKSSGIASVTTSLLLIHFFSSIPCCEKKKFELIEDFNCFLMEFYWFYEIVHVETVLYCLCCICIPFFVVWSHSDQTIVRKTGELLAPYIWHWYSYNWTGSLILGRHRNLKQFLSFRELALLETSIRCLLSGLLVLREIWISVQSSRVEDQILLVVCQWGILLCTLMQICKHVLLCQACSGLAVEVVANTIFSQGAFHLGFVQ